MKSKKIKTVIFAVYLVVAQIGLASDVEAPLPQDDSFIVMMRGVHAWMDASVPAGATIFIGDSITMGLATAAVAPYSVNYGIAGQRSDQLIKSMDIYQSIARASRVFVMIGTNDVLQIREADIQSRYQAVLAKIPANVEVVMSSIPPVGDVFFADGRKVDDKNVRDLVAISKKICEVDRRCRFVNAYEALSTDDKPTQGVLLPDQIHLSPKGYQLWIEALRRVQF